MAKRQEGYQVDAKTVLKELYPQLVSAAQSGNLGGMKSIVKRCPEQLQSELLNQVNRDGWTLLHHAVASNRRSVVAWLLLTEGRAAGFNKAAHKNVDGLTALHIASWRQYRETWLDIVHGCRDDNGERQEMLNAKDNRGWTVLHFLANALNPTLIKTLLGDGKEENRMKGLDSATLTALTKEKSQSALHMSIANHSDRCWCPILDGCTSEERTSLFLAADEHGWTVLFYAVQSMNDELVCKILSYPECAMIINRKDNRGMTVLHRAIIGGCDEESSKEWSKKWYPFERIFEALFANNNQTERENWGFRRSWNFAVADVVKSFLDPNIAIGL